MGSKLLHIAWLATPNLGNQWLRAGNAHQAASNGFIASVHPASGIGKLGKEELWRAGLAHHLAKDNIRHGLHRGQGKERAR